MTLKFSPVIATATLGLCPPTPEGRHGEGAPASFHSLCGFKNVLFPLHWPHSGSSLLPGDNRGLLESAQPPGRGVPLGKRERNGPPPRVGSVPPFLRKDVVTVSPLSSNLNQGSKPLPRAQARVLKTRSLVKDAEKNLGSRPLGPPEYMAPCIKGSGGTERWRFFPSPSKALSYYLLGDAPNSLPLQLITTGLMLKLKFQYFGQLMRRADSLEKTLMLGKTEGKRRRGRQKRWLDGITDSMDMKVTKLREIVKNSCSPWGCKESD